MSKGFNFELKIEIHLPNVTWDSKCLCSIYQAPSRSSNLPRSLILFIFLYSLFLTCDLIIVFVHEDDDDVA
jgi:hypothetical protein